MILQRFRKCISCRSRIDSGHAVERIMVDIGMLLLGFWLPQGGTHEAAKERPKSISLPPPGGPVTRTTFLGEDFLIIWDQNKVDAAI